MLADVAHKINSRLSHETAEGLSRRLAVRPVDDSCAIARKSAELGRGKTPVPRPIRVAGLLLSARLLILN